MPKDLIVSDEFELRLVKVSFLDWKITSGYPHGPTPSGPYLSTLGDTGSGRWAGGTYGPPRSSTIFSANSSTSPPGV